VRIRDLQPGDHTRHAGDEAVFLTRIRPHPKYPNLDLVIWYMLKSSLKGYTWSLDALDPDMELPSDMTVDTKHRSGWLREVIERWRPNV